MEALWPELGAAAGVRNLHKAASYARKALGSRDAVVLREGRVLLAPNAELDIDVRRFLAGDADAYGGELLPDDRYAEWTISRREQLRELRVQQLHGESRWRAAIAADPADERAHRELMRVAADRGDRLAAARQFRELRHALAELGAVPGRQSEQLAAEISRGPPARCSLVVDAPMIGRDAELARATTALEQAAEGAGGALWIDGDVGIGKTRFAEQLLSLAGKHGWHLLRGSAREHGTLIPYEPFVEAFNPLLAGRPELLAKLSPEAERALALLDPLESAASAGGDGAARAHRILAAVAQLATVAARDRGLALIIDGMHAADSATLSLVNYLARAARGERMLVILTARSDLPAAAAERLRSSLLGDGDARRIELGPLAAEAIRELVRAATAEPPSEAAVEEITRRAAGNPLFAEELAAAPSRELPERLVELLAARIERADIDPLTLAALAISADGFSRDELAELLDCDPASVEVRLRRLVELRILREDGDGYRLRHTLLRDVARRALPEPTLRRLHARAAQLAQSSGERPERIAFHLTEAGDGAAAVPLLLTAARRAAEVGAYADGQGWAEQALEHAEPAQEADLYVLLAELRHRTGDPRAARAIEHAIERDPEREPALRVLQGRIELAAGRLQEADRALSRIDPTNADDRARAAVSRGMLAWFEGDIAAAAELAGEAEETMATSAELAEEEGAVLEDLKAMIAHDGGRWREYTMAAMAESWHEPALAGRVFDAYLCVTEYVLYAGEPYEELAEFAARLCARARKAGAGRGEAFGETVWGEVELLAGRVAAAARHLREAARLSRRVGTLGGESLARTRLGEALHALGDEVGAAAQLEEAVELAHASALADHVLYLAHGPLIRLAEDRDAALAAVDRAEALLAKDPGCKFCPTDYYLASTETLARAGELDRARRFLARAEGAAGLWRVGGWAPGLAAARAEIHSAEGDRRRAEVAMRRAADGFAAAGQRLRERRARSRLAEVAA